MSDNWYSITNRAESADEAEVRIYDEIGAYGVSAESFVKDIQGIKARRINVRLNTPGGSVFDGTAIHNALDRHPAEIVMHVDGVAASAGSFIAMAGDEIRMADNAYLMIHNARGGVMGKAEDMRRYADLLEKINGNIARMYAEKGGKDEKHWRGLMDAETWFTAEEAMAEGLVDLITKAEGESAKASFDLTIYNKVPPAALLRFGKTTVAAPVQSAAVSIQEITAMAEITPNTVQLPAAAVTPVVAQGVTIDAAEAHRKEMDRLKGMTNEAIFEQGRAKGLTQGVEQERNRFKAIVAVCVNAPAMAISACEAGTNPDSVKMAYDEATRVQAAATAREQEKDLEIARWKNLAITGGYPGGVATKMVAPGAAPSNPATAGMDHKAQAEWEWDYQPEVRNTASSKEIYVLARTAELDGTHRTFNGSKASA